MVESTGNKQRRFSLMVAKLIEFAYANGFEITFGEAYRPPETAKLYEEQGRGIKQSLHEFRLAIDLNLFKDGVYLTETEDHQPLGEYWESMGGSWGGRFEDGNHYSLEHWGIK